MKQTSLKPRSIHWAQVHSRLRASEGALEEALSASPERLEAIYRQRAARLAELPPQSVAVCAALPVLVFRLADEQYAIELKELAAVLPYEQCARVPGAPLHFLGVVNVRGELRVVVDLVRLLAPSAPKASGTGFVLLLERQHSSVGLKVDRIERLDEIPQECLSSAAPGDYLKGMSGALMLLDMNKLLAGIVLEEESSTT